MLYLLYAVGSYVIGSIPVAYVLVKLIKKQDIRKVGSGNVGATNAGRVLGRKGFIAVLLLDSLKGFLPVFIALKLSANYPEISPNLALVAAVPVVLGHTLSLFLKFKGGGKGVATSLGVYLALAPKAVLIALAIFTLTVLVFRMISLGSIVAAIALSVLVVALYSWHELWIMTAIMAIFVIVKHKANIKRILNGTESKVNLKL